MSDAALATPGLQLRALEPEQAAPSRTALTGFVGVAERGLLNRPQPVRSFGDFVAVFGQAWRYGALGDSLYAFFLNGGEEACVVRVAREEALAEPAVGGAAAKQDLGSATALTAIRDANGDETLRLASRSPGAWGNALSARVFADSSLQLELGRLTTSAPAGATQLRVDNVYDLRVGGYVRLAHATNPFLKSEHQVSALDPALLQLTLTPALSSAYPSGSSLSGPGFRLELSDGARRETFDGLSMYPAHARYFVEQINGPAHLSDLELARQGRSLLVSASQVFAAGGRPRHKPADSPAISFGGGADGITFAAGILRDAALAARLTVTSRQGGRAGAGLRLRAEPFLGRLALAVPSEPGGARDRLSLVDIRDWRAGDTLTITHATQPALNESADVLAVDADQHLLVLAAPLVNDYALDSTCSVTGRFNLHVSDPAGARARESFFNLSLAAGPRLCTTLVNGPSGSGLVALAVAPGPGAAPVGEVMLAGGSDPDEVPLAALTGYEADGSLFQAALGGGPVGLAALEAVPEVSLVAMPDIVRRGDLSDAARVATQRQLLFHCQKVGERFALLDLPWGLTPAQALVWPEHFADPSLARYGAAYYPWLSMAVEQTQRWVPPSGVVAGAFARIDRQKGVAHAPANVQLKGAVALERDLDAAGQGALNGAGVNCIRKFEVGALRLWGARTLSREVEHLYVHHRRLLLLAIRGLRVGLRWAVFEPNDAGLQRRIKTSIEGFLRGLLAGAAAAGTRVDDAFYVNVGDDLNGAATRDAGQLLAEVGIALSKPAEFIVISVKRTPDILTLVEAET